MGKWRVYNKHPQGLTHRERFKDLDLEIKYGDYVEMDYEDAVQFRGQYFPIKKDAQGVQDPSSFKVIELVRIDSSFVEPEKPVEFISPMDGKKFASKEAYDAHMKQFDGMQIVDEAAEAEIASKVKNKRG